MENNILSQKSGVEATVIIPTFGRADFVIWAIKSAQQQTITDIEIFVIGDGASPVTINIVERASKEDPRIHFFDNPKGERNGELHRHQAMLQSKGKIICYLGHDDLWFPEHIEVMLLLLKDSDFGHSVHTYILGNETIHGFLPLISDPLCRSRMLQHRWNRFGPTCAAHTRNIYFNLPFGWRPAPGHIWSDLHMWRQFITHRGCRFATLPKTTTISFPRSLRQEYSVEQREKEIAKWFPRLTLPGEAQRLSMEAIQSASSELLRETDFSKNHRPSPTFLSLLIGKLYLVLVKLFPNALTTVINGIVSEMVTRSGLFNSKFYMERYHNHIKLDCYSPMQHYLKIGWKTGKHPSSNFDSDYYLTTHYDVLKAGINPLVHYILHGYREKRSAIKLLNSKAVY